MKVIDLTHTISESMPVYPGTEGPKLKIANTYEKHGFKETLLTMFSHCALPLKYENADGAPISGLLLF